MNILFLTHRLPYAPNRGDRVRAFHLLREMSSWARVHLVSLVHDEEEASHVGDLRDLVETTTTRQVPLLKNKVLAAMSLPSRVPTTHTMLSAPGLAADVSTLADRIAPDIVMCYCTGVAPLTSTPGLSQIPLVLDMVDVDSEKWAAMAPAAKPPMSWVYRREARTLARYEADIALRSRCTTVVTERERQALRTLAPAARIEVVPNGVDYASLRASTRHQLKENIVFCGVMNYAPNVEAVAWFVTHVWPLVRRQLPDASFTIVGSQPDARVLALSGAPGVEVTGAVDDVRPYLWRATVSVAPLLVGRGVQNKVLEAIAAGLPAVVTPVVAKGLPEEVLSACRIADGADAFSREVTSLMTLPQAAREQLVASADFVALSWQRRLEPFQALLRESAVPRR